MVKTKYKYLQAKSGKIIREHTKVLKDNGIEVPKGFVVHHKDGNKSNNSLSNLQVLSNREHTKLHRNCVGKPDRMSYIPVICPLCFVERQVRYDCTQRKTFTGVCLKCNGSINGVNKKF
jgi:hypothetical protein